MGGAQKERPTANELLDDYLKALDLLTINNESRISKKLQELRERDKENQYLIKAKLQEKDDQIQVLKVQMGEVGLSADIRCKIARPIQ
jgi:hypothetical protein